MHFSSTLFSTALLASLCLVQGAPVASSSSKTPGLPPLLKPSATSTKPAASAAVCTVTPTVKTTSTKVLTSTSKTVATATATKLIPVVTPFSAIGNGTKSSCFPGIGFKMPSTVPNSLDNWWCSEESEYAFLGFSYEISACQSQKTLNREFLDARNRFNSRYIRLYGACDTPGYYDKVIEAAWNAGLGVHALIWFGFDGDDSWKGRKKDLFKSLTTNPKAKFVTRGVQFGSEPLFDWAIDPIKLAHHVTTAKEVLAPYKIPITVSDLAWGFQSTKDDGSLDVLKAVDYVSLHMLPYFAPNAVTGGLAWPNNMYDMNQILGYTNSKKKIIWTENGWPSTHDCPGVCPNSKTAVSSVKSEHAYFDLLDSKCTEMKKFPKGGVGWFAHIYSDNQEPGYGILDTKGNLKFDFAPRISC